MIRILLFLVVIIVAILGFGWMSATAMPSWYDESQVQNPNSSIERFARSIESKGIKALLDDKLSQLLSGNLTLDHEEFNALLLTSLASRTDGRKLLAISDIVRAQLNQGELEIGSIVNMDKLKKQYPDIGRKINKLADKFPIINREKIYLAIKGQPIANNGELALADDFGLKIGKLAIPESILTSLGVPIDRYRKRSIKLNYLKIKEIILEKNKIEMAVTPSF